MKLDRTAYRTVPASVLEEGIALEPLTETVTYAMVVMSASATWTFFGGHTDTAYAQLQGRRDIYLATGPINGLVDRYLAVPQTAARATKRLMRSSFERDFAAVYADSLPALQRCLASPEAAAAREAWARRLAARRPARD